AAGGAHFRADEPALQTAARNLESGSSGIAEPQSSDQYKLRWRAFAWSGGGTTITIHLNMARSGLREATEIRSGEGRSVHRTAPRLSDRLAEKSSNLSFGGVSQPRGIEQHVTVRFLLDTAAAEHQILPG